MQQPRIRCLERRGDWRYRYDRDLHFCVERQGVKWWGTGQSIELAAERLQNQLLADRLPLRPAERDAVNAEDLRSVLSGVVTFFLETRRDTPIADLLSSIEEIVEAAMQDTR